MFFFILLILVVLGYLWWKNRSLPPGPWGLPIVGYLPFLDPVEPHISLTDLSKKYGGIYGLQLGSIYTVVLSDAKTIKKVFNSDAAIGRPPLYLTNGLMQGYGLICAQGDLWKDQRKFVFNQLRHFGASKIGQNRHKMQDLIIFYANDFINYIQTKGNPAIIDPLEPLRHSLGCIMNKLIFGKTFQRDDETWLWLQYLQEEGTKQIGVAGPLNFLSFLRFLPKFKRTRESLLNGKLETHKLYQKWIEDEPKTDKEPSNFIQAFLIEREKHRNSTFYSNQQFYHLLADIFGAGLDTTLTTLRWYLLYLSQYQEVQMKIRQQLKEVLQGNGPVLDDLSQLPYVEASLAEVQRIRSVVPVGIPHGCLKQIEIGGFQIQEGTMILPLQWAVHMNEVEWKVPDCFQPERFIDEEGRFFKPESFIPFQAGKRMCVGDEFAKMLLFLFGATIVQNYKISSESTVDLKGDCGITLTPKTHKLVFTKI